MSLYGTMGIKDGGATYRKRGPEKNHRPDPIVEMGLLMNTSDNICYLNGDNKFDSRPVSVWTNDHIDAHFTACFTALVLIRLLAG